MIKQESFHTCAINYRKDMGTNQDRENYNYGHSASSNIGERKNTIYGIVNPIPEFDNLIEPAQIIDRFIYHALFTFPSCHVCIKTSLVRCKDTTLIYYIKNAIVTILL